MELIFNEFQVVFTFSFFVGKSDFFLVLMIGGLVMRFKFIKFGLRKSKDLVLVTIGYLNPVSFALESCLTNSSLFSVALPGARI